MLNNSRHVIARTGKSVAQLNAAFGTKRFRRLALGAAAWGIAAPALAQTPPVNPLRAAPLGSPIPRVLPQAPEVVLPPTQPSEPLRGANVPNATVRVASVGIEGATAYRPAVLLALAGKLTGPAVPLSRIESARLAILKRYRGDGYVLSTVAASIDANGALKFVVTEGRIASVKLSRDIGPAGTQVLKFLQRLTEVQPIDEATLERYLLLAQDVAGVTLHALLQPSAEEPGALNLIADVRRAAVSGVVTTDNYASSYTGPVETLLVGNLNSFTSYGEQTQLSIYQGWPTGQTFGQASTEAFIGSSGLKFRVYFGDGDSTPTGVLAAENYRGITTVYGASLSYPLIRARSQTLNLTANFDGEDSTILTVASNTADYLRIVRLGANYARSDLLLGASRTAVNSVQVRLSQGLPILGASEDNGPNLPRPGEQPTFFKFDGFLSRTQALFQPWRDATFSVEGLLTGQWSQNILPPAEQFYLGGLQINRGYYSGEVVGDKALAATAEIQLDTGLDLMRLGVPDPVPAQFYAFYDWGEVWQNSSQSFATHINSAGGGVRINATRYAEVDFMGSARLNVWPTGSGAGTKPIVPGTFLWRLLARF